MSQGEASAGGRGGRNETNNLLRPLALATQLGMTMGLMTVGAVVAGLFLGSWIDRQLGTRPVATLICIVTGVLAGSLGMVHLAQSAVRQLNAAAARQVAVRTPFTAPDLGRACLLIVELILVTLVPIGLGLWLGAQLDGALQTRPVCTVVLGGLSVAVSRGGVYVLTARAARRAGSGS